MPGVGTCEGRRAVAPAHVEVSGEVGTASDRERVGRYGVDVLDRRGTRWQKGRTVVSRSLPNTPTISATISLR